MKRKAKTRQEETRQDKKRQDKKRKEKKRKESLELGISGTELLHFAVLIRA